MGAGERSKIVAILLAVFLGGWTWLYLYKYCARKFWIFIITSVLSLVGVFVAFASFASSLSTSTCENTNINCGPPSGFFVFFGLFGLLWLIYIGFHIYAIVDTCTKSEQWYAEY
jgi:hypothetical protein